MAHQDERAVLLSGGMIFDGTGHELFVTLLGFSPTNSDGRVPLSIGSAP